MFSSIHFKLEKKVDHHDTRHLADWEIGISMLLTFKLMVDLFAGTEKETTASHFSVLSSRPLDMANELTDVIYIRIWCLQSVRWPGDSVCHQHVTVHQGIGH